MTSEPPQNEIDSSTPDPVAEHDERRRQLGVRPHQRPPRGRRPEPDLVRRGQVAARRRRHVDQDLGAVEGQQLRHRQVPEVLADRRSRCPTPEPRRHGPQQVARRRRTAARRTARRSAGTACGGRAGSRRPRASAAAMNSRWSADSSTNDTTADRPRVARGQRGQARVVEAHRDLGREVLEQVAGQPELGEDDEVGAACPRLREQLAVAREVVLERARAAARSGRARSGARFTSQRAIPR